MILITAAAYVAIFVWSLDFKIRSTRVDKEFSYLILEAIIQHASFLLIKIVHQIKLQINHRSYSIDRVCERCPLVQHRGVSVRGDRLI